MPLLPIEEILNSPVEPSNDEIGRSRAGEPIRGAIIGSGDIHVSLIGGCHADEPVGPWMLEKLIAFLSLLGPDHSLLTEFTWHIVAHVNPDGRRQNDAWTRSTTRIRDHQGLDSDGFDLHSYLKHVVRELPGDDIEFGFPRSSNDHDARPENRSVAEFLRGGAPYSLHGSFHGMAMAPGPWFLIEPAWIDRTATLRRNIRQRVGQMAYHLFDPDRGGDKGFHRIDRGFCTRPDSSAMRSHFMQLGDAGTAAKFRPSSMEFVRQLGGDPLTFVSEMPLFLTPREFEGRAVEISELGEIRARLSHDSADRICLRRTAHSIGIVPMAVHDQQRLQLALLEESLRCVRLQS